MEEAITVSAAPSTTERCSSRRRWRPHLLVGVVEEVADATEVDGVPTVRLRLRRQHRNRDARRPGAVPGLRRGTRNPRGRRRAQLPWLADAEDRATSWIITTQLPEYLAEVQPRRAAELAKCRDLVVRRLEDERDRLLLDATVAAERYAGERGRSAESLNRKAVELDTRLRHRLELLDKQALMSTKPPPS